MSRTRILPLGTSSGAPTRERSVSAVAVTPRVHTSASWILLDCGEGAQHRMLQSPLRPSQLEAVFLTHLHGDHCFGLPGLLSSLSLQGRVGKLRVHGPPGLREWMDVVFRVSRIHLSFELEIAEVNEGGWIYSARGVRVLALPLSHRIEAFGYRLELSSGLSLAYCTDTVPCESAVRLGSGADLLIHEATYSQDLMEKAMERGHSTSAGAAWIARRARCRRLLLTHFSPRYRDLGPLVAEVRAIFPWTEAARDLVPLELGVVGKTRPPDRVFARSGG